MHTKVSGEGKRPKRESGRFDSAHINRNQSNIILAKSENRWMGIELKTLNRLHPFRDKYTYIEMENESHSSNIENTYSY
jgi:hypothetical protein